MRRTRTVPFCAVLLLLAGLALTASSLDPGAATGQSKGTYRAKTFQQSVAGFHRTITFRVKGRTVWLTKEPVIRRGFCTSTPVFLLEQEQIRKRINSRGKFTFARTHLGNKVNRITGSFVEENRIEGVILYWFDESPIGLCRAGKQRVRFIAKRR